MKIGIDLDDVVAAFIGTFVTLLNTKYGTPPVGTLPIDWEWSNFGLTTEQLDAAWKDVANIYNFWESLEVCPGVGREMLRMMDRQHELFFITARVRTNGIQVKNQSANWLRDRLGIMNPTVIVTSNKGPLAKALGLDYFVDDRPKNCIEVYNATDYKCKCFLKNSSHNASRVDKDIYIAEWMVRSDSALVQGDSNYTYVIPRVKDFDEFADIVNLAHIDAFVGAA